MDSFKEQLVLDTFETVLTNVSDRCLFLINDYMKNKLTRRVLNDYIGNDQKLALIYKKITKLDNSFKQAIEELKREVG
jgi:hypothetical protein